MTPAIAPFVSAISVMLAAYGFFYNATKATIDAGFDVKKDALSEQAKEDARAAVKRARNAALTLGLVPLAVFAMLAPKLVFKLTQSWRPADYSTLDVIFVVLSLSWLGIAVFLLWQYNELRTKLTELPA